MTEQSSTEKPFTVYYDGDCPLCTKEIETYRKATGADQLAWVDAANSDQRVLGQDLDSQTALARMHVRDAALMILEPAYRLFLKIRPMWRKPAQRA